MTTRHLYFLPQSITWRLTLWYAAVLTLILLAVGGLTYGAVAVSMKQQARDRLLARAEVVRRHLEGQATQEEGQHVDLTDRDLLGSGDGFYLQILGPGGQVLNRSSNVPSGFVLPLTATPVNPVLAEFSGQPFLYLTLPLSVGERPGATLQVALPWEANEEFLRALRFFLLLAGGAGLLAALAGGFFIARLSLKPVAAITRAATSISHQDLSQRLQLTGPQDELYHLTQAFNNMLDRLEKAFDEQRRFVADASHELRTPLAALRGYAGLLARWGQEDPLVRREAISAIEREADFLARLVDRLLLLARSDSGLLQPTAEPLSLDELLAEVAADARILSSGLDFQVGPLERVQMKGDPIYLRELIFVLLDNAFKYTAPGGLVRLALVRKHDRALITISDTGAGIPAEEIPRIFDRFYRVDKARSRQKGGSGLGLAIARWIVESHGGTIEVESRVGAGTTFTVKLPIL